MKRPPGRPLGRGEVGIGLTADVEDRDLGSTVADLQRRLRELSVPEGFSVNVAGEWEHQQESFASLQLGFVLALVLMYMVMASQFESLRDPVLILVSVPLAAIGVILMLVYTGTTLNVQSFIGMVMLAGIVVNNAIVLVDSINQLQRSGTERNLDELIVHAARRRFRPILMTMLTTVLAMIPIAVGWGEGGELQAPMARVVVGGLLSSTLVSLLAIPLVSPRAGGARGRAAEDSSPRQDRLPAADGAETHLFPLSGRTASGTRRPPGRSPEAAVGLHRALPRHRHPTHPQPRR